MVPVATIRASALNCVVTLVGPAAWDNAIERACAYCCNRSEEHTSELQSHLNIVCRLLLETKTTPSEAGWRGTARLRAERERTNTRGLNLDTSIDTYCAPGSPHGSSAGRMRARGQSRICGW